MGFLGISMVLRVPLLYGEIEERSVCHQPKGFEDPYYPKLCTEWLKNLYGLHQALEPDSRDLLLVQVYVVLSSFLGVIINKACQDKYVKDMLHKFDMESGKNCNKHPVKRLRPMKDETDHSVIHQVYSMTSHCWKPTVTQTIVATSSTEAVYVAVLAALWSEVDMVVLLRVDVLWDRLFSCGVLVDRSTGCVFLLSAWFLLLVDSFCWLNTFMLLALFMLSIHLVMLLNCFCCAQFDIDGWLVSATSHLVSAGSLQSC
ncbi:hypothetical protein Tco_0876157 [Tanacetum coccineum]|uniref:Uncharacterized protein n=1 Tax=Tanacetum coccineum TaxID=301880 RepID=A0ABQ5BRI6_9ASTR